MGRDRGAAAPVPAVRGDGRMSDNQPLREAIEAWLVERQGSLHDVERAGLDPDDVVVEAGPGWVNVSVRARPTTRFIDAQIRVS